MHYKFIADLLLDEKALYLLDAVLITLMILSSGIGEAFKIAWKKTQRLYRWCRSR